MKLLLILLAICIVALIAIALFIWQRFKVRKINDDKRRRA